MTRTATGSELDAAQRRFVAGGIVFGVGLGGLADGIILHHVLQWHNFLSAEVATDSVDGLRTNLLADGLFHLSVTIILLIGFVLLWRSQRERGRLDGGAVVGLSLVGWGAFNMVDNVVFHELLDLHDIRQGVDNPGVYNWSYFAIGAVLFAVGALIVRRHRDRL